MTVKVTIAADGREVVIETDDDAPIAAVVADALTAWDKTRPATHGPASKPAASASAPSSARTPANRP